MKIYSEDDYLQLYTTNLQKLDYGWFERKKEDFKTLAPDPESGNLVFVESCQASVYKDKNGEYWVGEPKEPESRETLEFSHYEEWKQEWKDKTEISLIDYCS